MCAALRLTVVTTPFITAEDGTPAAARVAILPAMGDIGLYLVFLIPPLLIGLGVQWRLKRTVAEQLQVPVSTGMTGAQVARAILDRNGLNDVPVERSPGGPLSDHYDPRKRAVFLSEPVHDGIAVASTAIGAHEVGHAIQHATAYGAFRVRSALVARGRVCLATPGSSCS